MITRKEYFVNRGGELVSKCVSRRFAEERRQQAQAELEVEGLSPESMARWRVEIREVEVFAWDQKSWLDLHEQRDVDLYFLEIAAN